MWYIGSVDLMNRKVSGVGFRRKILISDSGNIMSDELKMMREYGYDTIRSRGSKETMELMQSHCPDMLILNANDSAECAGSFGSWTDAPLFVVCSDAADTEKFSGCAGIMDFIVRPFSDKEFLLRISRMLHYRDVNRTVQCGDDIVIGDMTIDCARRRVYMDGKDAGLTYNEFRIVALLGKNAGSAVSHDEILCHLWGPNSIGGNRVLRVHIANIRRKIERDTSAPRYLHTVTGVGYMIEDSGADK